MPGIRRTSRLSRRVQGHRRGQILSPNSLISVSFVFKSFSPNSVGFIVSYVLKLITYVFH